MNLLNRNLSLITLFVLILFLVCLSVDYMPNNILSWDLWGAYLYLPANFIYDDPHLQDISWINEINGIYQNTPSYYQFWTNGNGNHQIMYSMGFAVLFAPFFFLAHLFAGFSDYPQDGFSEPYQMAIYIGHVFYMVLGLVFLWKILRIWFNEKIVSLVLVICCLGTNYYAQNIFAPASPHTYLFALFAIVIYLSYKWNSKPSIKCATLLGLVIGLMTLARLTELLIILIPFLWGVTGKESFKKRVTYLKQYKKHVFIILGIIVLCLVPQVIYYWNTAGEFRLSGYNNPGEGMDLHKPNLFNYLFSFRKGWILYTPIIVFSIVGLIWMRSKKDPPIGAFLIFFLINLYVLSCWSNWWYASSFGQRSMIEAYPLLMIGMAVFINRIMEKKAIILSIIPVFLILIAFNLFQSWQYINGLIHTQLMTKEAYMIHFLKTEPHYQYHELLLIDHTVPPEAYMAREDWGVVKEITFGFENQSQLELDGFPQDPFSLSKFVISNRDEYLWGHKIPLHTFTKDDQFILEVKASYSNISENTKWEDSPLLVVKLLHGKGAYREHYLQLQTLELDSTGTVLMYFHIPPIRSLDDELELFFWNPKFNSVDVHCVQVKVWRELN